MLLDKIKSKINYQVDFFVIAKVSTGIKDFNKKKLQTHFSWY